MTYNVNPVTNDEDLIDSRDVIARIEYLKEAWHEATGEDHADYVLSEDDWAVGLGTDEAAELVALIELAEEGEQYASDWQHGATLIRDSYFEDYARELAEDIGAINPDAGWPTYCIDWERAARDLQMDYSSIEFGDVTYWVC